MSAFIPKKITYPIELYTLIKEGFLVPRKTKLQTNKGLLKFIKLIPYSNRIHVVMEDANGVSMVFNTNQFKDLNCETINSAELTYEPWIDPA